MKYPIVEGSFRSPHGAPMRMAYRENTNDWNTLNATLTEDEYGLPSGLSGVAVDIGAYLGSVAIALALDNPGLEVIAIEPVWANADLIERNVAANEVWNRVKVVRGAVGAGDAVTVAYGFKGTEASEHHAFVGNSTLGYGLTHDARVYKPITLQGLVDRYGDIAFMKIDCEGGEWPFLTGPLERVARIVGESHAIGGHKGGDIVERLAATHRVTVTGDPEGTVEFMAAIS
jgi:FkbM family methyltransferase